MSKYTTEIRFICEEKAGLNESKGYNDVKDIIQAAIPYIFDFDFPIFDEAYKNVLETKILKHYYTREIGLETYGLWKLKLDTKLNEIMPYYNKLYLSELLEFNPLYTHDFTRTHKLSKQNSQTSADVASTQNSSSSNSNVSAAGSESNSSTDLYSDTPQGQIANLEQNGYLTNARKINDANVHSDNTATVASSSDTSNTQSQGVLNGTSLDDYIERVIGYQGVNASKLLVDFRNTFLNIDMMIIKDLEELFFQLW